MTTIEVAEIIGKVAGAALGVFGVIAAIVKGMEWIGKHVARFVDEKLVPPINQLTKSVEDLSTKTHENTVEMVNFATDQRRINERTATQIAEVRGRLGMDA